MRGVRRIPKLHNAPVLVRGAFNVPIEQGVVRNTFRLRQALPTIEFLQKKGARVILCGHIGEKGTETFEPVYQALKKMVPSLAFCPVSIGKEARDAVRHMRPGDVLLLENLRRHRGEVMNDPAFAAELASLADIFVQDSFDVCHRKHASVVGLPTLLPAYAGLLVENEVKQLTKALRPKNPSLAIIGGAKFSTKEPVLNTLLTAYSQVFVGGALANDFLQEKGYPIEDSLVSGEDVGGLRALLQRPHLLLPVDEVIGPRGSTVDQGHAGPLDGKEPYEAILDNGPETIRMLAPYVQKAKTILWNGPLGYYEGGYTAGTKALAESITASSAFTILGGGDTVAAIEALGLSQKFSFVSTGGGAMLDFLATGTLPGIEALG